MMTSEYIYTNDTPVLQLDAEIAFNGLTDDERLYAHYLSKSSWFGSIVVLFQTSPESPLIFILFRKLFKSQTIEELKQLAENVAKFGDKEWTAFLVYFSGFLANMGNYKGFGDSKFIPNLPKSKFETLVLSSKAFKDDEKQVQYLWDEIKDRLYSLETNQLALGFNPKGTTTYFSSNCTEEDSKTVEKFMTSNKIEAWNTRVFKNSETNTFDIRFASILSTEDKEENGFLEIQNPSMDGNNYVLSRGDYSPILQLLNKYLIEAEKYARNETEKEMIREYVKHFRTGSLNAHKDGSRQWIKDKGPIVETYIGFIENYRDPAGQRSEFEGFVAIVNKEMSKKFTSLVSNASKFIALLPWPKAFEKDKFLEPDFTSLDVLTFAGSGIPAGINIPNYDEIRQNEGFKNVSLGNVITASLKDPKPNYMSAEDAKLLEKYAVQSFEVQVGLHELLGHGSGKLLIIDDQKENFDLNKTINPLNDKPVDQWYKSGESYASKFTSLSSSYEECRAECVGLYLCLEPNILSVFGLTDSEEQKRVIYVNWLLMVRSGLESLQMYKPEVNKWLQAHSQARYVIARVLLESAPDLLKIKYLSESESSDGKPDLLIELNEALIETKGKKAIEEFLIKLQIFKSLGDISSAQQMFEKYSEVSEHLEYNFVKFREIVLKRKKARKIFVEYSTKLNGEKVELKKYESTHEAMLLSFLDHFDGETDLDETVIEVWKQNQKYFN